MREFNDYTQLSHPLKLLEREVKQHARKHRRSVDYCANEHWYSQENFRKQLINILDAGDCNPLLQTKEAYDVCYDHLYRMLPDCIHGGTCRG